MRAVNLLPSDLERQRVERVGRTPLFVAAGGVAVVTAAAVALFMSASGSISDQRGDLESLEASVAAVPSAGQQTVVPAAITQERTDRVAALSAALTTRVPLDRLLRDLGYVLPDDAWLTGLSVSAPDNADAATATPGTPAPASSAVQGVTIEGATYSNSSVARVLSRLSAIPSLEQVRLTATARVVPTTPTTPDATKTKVKVKAKATKQKTVVTFAIAANLRSGSGS
jgi:Tfp pilus assembly protein PilN